MSIKTILGSAWKIAFLQLGNKDQLQISVDGVPFAIQLHQDGSWIQIATAVGGGLRPIFEKETERCWVDEQGTLHYLGAFAPLDLDAFVRRCHWFVRVSNRCSPFGVQDGYLV
jgi:hypothetical protein